MGTFVVLGVLVYAVLQSGNAPAGPSGAEKALMDDSAELPGTYVPPHPGADAELSTDDDRQHVASGVTIPVCTAEEIAQSKVSDPVCYTSNPPTSGPHSSSPMPFRVLDNPAPRESLVHNMEHGGVVIWVNTTDPRIVQEIKSAVQAALDRRRLVVMSPYPSMEPETIALTSWTRLDKFGASEFNKKRIEDFIAVHQRRFNPEGF